jgi:peptide/nickel transport system permease protein
LKETVSELTTQGLAVATNLAPRVIHGFWAHVWSRLQRDRLALLGGVIILILVFVAVFADRLAPYDPLYQYPQGLSATGLPLPSSLQFLLGTDRFGRDVLSRLIYGARVSLTVGILANGLAILIGVFVGAISGFMGGWVESVLMRLIDVVLGIPMLLLAMALVAVWRANLGVIIVVIAVSYWTQLARVIHAEVLRIKQLDYILAAQAVGAPMGRILTKHVLPQLIGLIVVYLSLGSATTVMLEASLSYLGLGVPPPTPSWGGMVADGQSYFVLAPWLVIYPGLSVMLTVLGFNLMGDGLRDATDPTQWK